MAKAKDWVSVTLPDGTKAAGRQHDDQWAEAVVLLPTPTRKMTGRVRSRKRKELAAVILTSRGRARVLHLLFSRFWHKLLFDLGYAPSPEPFKKLVNQGDILAKRQPEDDKSEATSSIPMRSSNKRRRLKAAVRDVYGRWKPPSPEMQGSKGSSLSIKSGYHHRY
jgi:leucyl-tRNA synthetase